MFSLETRRRMLCARRLGLRLESRSLYQDPSDRLDRKLTLSSNARPVILPCPLCNLVAILRLPSVCLAVLRDWKVSSNDRDVGSSRHDPDDEPSPTRP